MSTEKLLENTTKPKSNSKIILIIAGVLVFGVVSIFTTIFAVDYFKNNKVTKVTETESNPSGLPPISENPSFISNKKPIVPEKIIPDSVTIKTLTMGDVFWGRYINDWAQKSPLKEAYPFSGLETFEKEKYDAWIANIECPITDAVIDSATQEKTLSFNCNSKYTPEAAKWFDIMTLANNHTDNMQTYLGKPYDGFKKTKENLEANAMQYFGHYDSAVKEDLCEVVSIFSKQEKVWVPIASCGFHNIFKLPTADQISVITEYSKYLPTFVYPHQGKEYRTVADDYQRTYARKYIDAGADAVIGDHVHVVQDTDVYKGKLIVYSLGNFIFDQQRGNTTQALVLDSKITFKNDDNFQKFTELGETCKKFKDDCLAQFKAKNLVKPTFEINYEMQTSDNSNKLAKKASPAVRDIILKQAKWASTKAILQKASKN